MSNLPQNLTGHQIAAILPILALKAQTEQLARQARDIESAKEAHRNRPPDSC